jgi:1-acyl-sn-glycerol-3-phosphate acyltransferase
MSRGQQIAYALVRSLLRLAVLLLTRVHVRGLEYLPHAGAGIVVSNHIAAVDPGVQMAVLPRPIALMSKVENARGILKLFIPLLGSFTVRRGAIDRRALQIATQVLEQSRLLCMFPEGTRSVSGVLGAAHGGAALLAIKSAAPIIPVAITGTPQIFLRHFPWLGRPCVTVTVGAPFDLAPPDGMAQRSDRERATGAIMARIAALLPPELRGVHAGSPPDAPVQPLGRHGSHGQMEQ